MNMYNKKSILIEEELRKLKDKDNVYKEAYNQLLRELDFIEYKRIKFICKINKLELKLDMIKKMELE